MECPCDCRTLVLNKEGEGSLYSLFSWDYMTKSSMECSSKQRHLQCSRLWAASGQEAITRRELWHDMEIRGKKIIHQQNQHWNQHWEVLLSQIQGGPSCIELDLDYVFGLIQGSPNTPIPKLEKPGMDPMVGCVLIIQVKVLLHWMDPNKNWVQVLVHGFHAHRPKQLKPCAHIVHI